MNAPVGEVIAINLIKLTATLILEKDEILPVLRLERTAGDRLGKKCNLPAIATRKSDKVQLHGVGKTSADQELAFGGMPILDGRGSKFQVAGNIRLQLWRKSRNSISHQIFRDLR